eukprot:2907890-Pleurochrysis_carterae.AAC.3
MPVNACQGLWAKERSRIARARLASAPSRVAASAIKPDPSARSEIVFGRGDALRDCVSQPRSKHSSDLHFPYVRSAWRQVICHGIPDSYKLKDGDIVNIDVTCYVGGYHGDCSQMSAHTHTHTLAVPSLNSTSLRPLLSLSLSLPPARSPMLSLSLSLSLSPSLSPRLPLFPSSFPSFPPALTL